MGYYTNYDISDNSEEVINAIEEKSDYSSWYQGEIQSVKWYRWKEDVAEVSKSFPEEVITVGGEGEESVDIWKAYFLDGKCQYEQAKLSFEEFDKNKLEEV